ncbi:uncharacterized protein LOC18433045 [Amborella trichopoda]|uniref:uncharacterized protein LOC18433045 n=1 Tax=Amborella trichopoda TaxID=13333 RepID=UPI0005D43F1B|nr:uncharacterized protein LOC18433045 [Amborella trichopoda]|eukprot:XP_011622915.1 uncharacterized protein LOC18433045 [Amborella trichopoda]
MMGKPRAIIVGGSISGLACAHSLGGAGWDVVVVEKASGLAHSGSSTGAGLGLDRHSCRVLAQWLTEQTLLHGSLPLKVDQNQATDSEKKVCWTLARDDDFGFRAAHWGDLHALLYYSLPPQTVLWGHHFLSFQRSQEGVQAQVEIIETDSVIKIVGDLLVAADGCLSAIRRHFFPDHKLRYLGYSAWRGVLDFSENEYSDIILGLRRVYPELGNCLYFDLAQGTHCVIYEIQNKRINWIWYVNQPEPQSKGNSMTVKVRGDMVEKMHQEAEKAWVPELARLMKETKEPFINIMYDSDPLVRLSWDNVVLVGDAAHPTSPHGLRSTNMSILDAWVLGHSLRKSGVENLGLALKEYESLRLPVVSKQVLHSRHLGRLKQGFLFSPPHSFPWKNAGPEEREELLQRKMPFFEEIPLPGDILS